MIHQKYIVYLVVYNVSVLLVYIMYLYRPPNNYFTSFFNEFSDLIINSNNTIFVGNLIFIMVL